MRVNPILIVEDEPALASAIGRACERIGCATRLCASGKRALSALEMETFALAIVDIGLPDMSGLELLSALRESAPRLPVVIITAHANLENAVKARQRGASAYLTKPLDLDELQQTLRQALATSDAAPAAAAPSGTLIGTSPRLQRSFVEIAHACASDAPVVLTGPTGTGKTHTARLLHQNSRRASGPFVTLHCSALTESLLEAELFGHERGAFTGANAAKPGHIERAEGGTLFLDEIADIAPSIQAKLLRFVEERVFHRVGGREERRVDCRLITATHRDLRAEVEAGRFREDLYYRLHVLEIFLPPLRERSEDLAALAAHFLAERSGERPLSLAPETLAALQSHAWPGNVRELRNAIEHAVAVCSGSQILPQHLPRAFGSSAVAGPGADFETLLKQWLDLRLAEACSYREMHDQLEAMALRHLLARFGGKPTILAREMKMNRVTLRRKWRELGGAPLAGEDAPVSE
jgi:DNA-binding NtrC family response regulator